MLAVEQPGSIRDAVLQVHEMLTNPYLPFPWEEGRFKLQGAATVCTVPCRACCNVTAGSVPLLLTSVTRCAAFCPLPNSH